MSEANGKSKKFDLVTKLIQMAMDERTPPEEAHNAMVKATAIMTKEKIAIAEVMRTKEQAEEAVVEDKVKFTYGDTNQKWERSLLMAVSKPFDCECILLNSYKPGTYRSMSWDRGAFIGHPTDVENCKYFFGYLQFTIAGMIRRCNFRKVVEKDSYGAGVVLRVGERLKEMFKKVDDSLPSDTKAVMVLKKDAAKSKFKELYPHTKSVASRRTTDWNARSKGYKDGGKVALRTGVGGGAATSTLN